MKLTNAMRDDLRKRAYSRAFAVEFKDLDARINEFGERVRIARLGGAENAALADELNAKVPGIVNTSGGFDVQCNSGGFAGQFAFFAPYPYRAHESYRCNDFEAEALKLGEERDALTKRREDVVRSLKVALASLTTTTQVREAFPEMAAMLPEEGARNLPAINYAPVRDALCAAGVLECATVSDPVSLA